MANMCFNYITIFGDTDAIKQIKSKYFEDIYDEVICEETENELTFSHESKWSPPEKWVQEMSCYGVTIECEYDESGSDICGKFGYINGNLEFNLEFTYLEGKYNLTDWTDFVECEVLHRIEDNEDVESFLEDFDFVSDEHREELITIFNEGV
jgi:hypothetical protein